MFSINCKFVGKIARSRCDLSVLQKGCRSSSTYHVDTSLNNFVLYLEVKTYIGALLLYESAHIF